MKYQALKHLKTKRKLLKICSTIEEAVAVIRATGAQYEGTSYIGGFPIFRHESQTYSIQGMVEGLGIVCSLPQKEVESVQVNWGNATVEALHKVKA